MERIIRNMPSANQGEYCAFIGLDSCTEDASFAPRLYDAMEMLVFEGYTHFICDASCRAGLQAAELICSLRRSYQEITLELAFTSDIRAQRCSTGLLDLLYRADVVTFVSRHHDLEATRRLKNYLVNQGSLIFAESDSATGLTDPSVMKAQRDGRQVTHFPNAVCHLAMAI